MTYWREASTLLLAVHRSVTMKMPAVARHQGISRTLANNTLSLTDNEDYSLLMLKRNQKSSFFPSSFVFPGGTFSTVDGSCDWKPLFEHIIGKPFADIEKYFHVEAGVRPPIITHSQNLKSSEITADIAFRICAIRETFEECGVLLVTNSDSLNSSWYDMDNETKRMWQSRVCQNADEFLTMCQQLSVVPNIWQLYEWSNWLTPPVKKVSGPTVKPMRFDTLFYICCAICEHLPVVTLDGKEVVAYQWITPTEYVCNNAGLSPQAYEMRRLSLFSRFDELNHFMKNRQKLGIERMMSTIIRCHDAVMFVLPGDELYPENPDCFGTQAEDSNTYDFQTKSYLEFCGESHVMHRHVLTKDGTAMLFINRTMPYSHAFPKSDEYLSKL